MNIENIQEVNIYYNNHRALKSNDYIKFPRKWKAEYSILNIENKEKEIYESR